ncbi:MAG: hypothetical protein ACI9AQ_002854, partial [Dinoroseobacter sp.]
AKAHQRRAFTYMTNGERLNRHPHDVFFAGFGGDVAVKVIGARRTGPL